MPRIIRLRGRRELIAVHKSKLGAVAEGLLPEPTASLTINDGTDPRLVTSRRASRHDPLAPHRGRYPC